MAQHQIGGLDVTSVVAKNRAVAASAAVTSSVYATPANYASLATLDARLTAISAAIFTQKVLDSMSVNDKVYAVRMNDDLNTI
jgi:hypothetical protein